MAYRGDPSEEVLLGLGFRKNIVVSRHQYLDEQHDVGLALRLDPSIKDAIMRTGSDFESLLPPMWFKLDTGTEEITVALLSGEVWIKKGSWVDLSRNGFLEFRTLTRQVSARTVVA